MKGIGRSERPDMEEVHACVCGSTVGPQEIHGEEQCNALSMNVKLNWYAGDHFLQVLSLIFL